MIRACCENRTPGLTLDIPLFVTIFTLWATPEIECRQNMLRIWPEGNRSDVDVGKTRQDVAGIYAKADSCTWWPNSENGAARFRPLFLRAQPHDFVLPVRMSQARACPDCPQAQTNSSTTQPLASRLAALVTVMLLKRWPISVASRWARLVALPPRKAARPAGSCHISFARAARASDVLPFAIQNYECLLGLNDNAARSRCISDACLARRAWLASSFSCRSNSSSTVSSAAFACFASQRAMCMSKSVST